MDTFYTILPDGLVVRSTPDNHDGVVAYAQDQTREFVENFARNNNL